MTLEEDFKIQPLMPISYLKMQSHRVITKMKEEGNLKEVVFTNRGKPEVLLRVLNEEEIAKYTIQGKKPEELTMDELKMLMERQQKKGSR